MEEFLIIKKFYDFKAKKSQIATLFVVMLGVLLLFTTVVLDIANVSFIKTNMDRAADSGACMMGSMLTSHAKQMSDQGVKGRVKYSESGGFFSGWFGEIIGWVIVIVGVIITGGAGGSFLCAIVGGAIAGIGAWTLSEVYRRQAVISAYADALKMFNTKEAKYRETVLLGVMGSAVDDPIKIVDTHDINQDGSTQDWINRFDIHYEQRLRSLILEQEGMSLGGGGGSGGSVDDARAAVEEIIRELGNLRNAQPDNLLALRDFLRVDFWDIFSQIDEPRYDSATLLSNYRAAEQLGYAARTRILDLGRRPGYIMDRSIWESSHPHAELSDDYPTGWGTLCEISDVIYSIYSESSDPSDPQSQQPSLIDAIDSILQYSVSELMDTRETWLELLYDGIDGPIRHWDPITGWGWIEDACDELSRWARWFGDWNDFLNSRRDEINNDIGDIDWQIAEIDNEIATTAPQEVAYIQALTDLRGSLQQTRAYLAGLLTDIDDSQTVISRYESLFGGLSSDFKLLAHQARLDQISDDHDVGDMTIGEAMYVWEDSKGWHLIKAAVGDVVLPWIRTKKKKKWNKTVMTVYLEPYAHGSQRVPITTYRFDEPIGGTPWWIFHHAAKKYNEQEWAQLRQDLEENIPHQGYMYQASVVAPDHPLYDQLDAFLEASAITAKATSDTSWASHVGHNSMWRISIRETE